MIRDWLFKPNGSLPPIPPVEPIEERVRRIRRFTPEEDEILRREYLAGTTYQKIAHMLGRSYGVIRQRLFHKHKDLKGRSALGTKLLTRYGRDVLAVAPTPEEASRIIRERKIAAYAAARAAAQLAKSARRRAAIEKMLADIDAGADRNEAVFEARATGLELEAIAREIGVTRERVRQICEITAFKIALKNGGAQ